MFPEELVLECQLQEGKDVKKRIVELKNEQRQKQIELKRNETKKLQEKTKFKKMAKIEMKSQQQSEHSDDSEGQKNAA